MCCYAFSNIRLLLNLAISIDNRADFSEIFRRKSGSSTRDLVNLLLNKVPTVSEATAQDFVTVICCNIVL